MAKGVNKVILVGYLGADPELRHTGSGVAIATLRIATSESWTDKQSGEKQERTEWHRAKIFGKLAEIAGEYLKKGRLIYIEGSLRTEKYTDKDSIERYSTDIVVTEMQMLGSGDSGSAGAGNQGGSSRANSGQQNRQNGGGQQQRPSSTGQNRPSQQHADSSYSSYPEADDIPFDFLRQRYW